MSSAKVGQVNPDGSKLFRPKTCWENKQGYLTTALLLFSLFSALASLCSEQNLCYFKMSHLKVISSDRHPLCCHHFSLITHLSSTVPAVSRWVRVSNRRDRIGVRLHYVCFPARMEAIKCVHGDFWTKIHLIYILNFLTGFPESIKPFFLF